MLLYISDGDFSIFGNTVIYIKVYIVYLRYCSDFLLYYNSFESINKCLNVFSVIGYWRYIFVG